MAEHDQWRDRDGGAVERLESALARIAVAAGRRQDALRVAELTARAAQHEADLLVQAEQQRREDAVAAEAADREREHRETLREAMERLDKLIDRLRSELEEPVLGV